ncbi:restriction endonuclease subunit S [Paraburkholderia adhaesiva]|uniref:restriction endonuclease subunit S n=1 Tax=Paraburkholderia adhaesiva TaxID=2883244 RepID=UPI001F285E37|nr:restriction endonuclease subunit S [Paraburkholderia adhaesiva]
MGVIPEEWEVKHLGDLGAIVRGGSPRPAGDPRYFNGNFIPWLTVAALTNVPDHQLHISETFGFLTEDGSKHSRTLKAGTLIIANSGATLGVAKVLNTTCCANDGIAAIINQRDGDKIFVCYFINSQTERLREDIATGNGQPNLNTTIIRGIALPFPRRGEQSAIAEALSDVDALLSGLDKLIAKKRDLKQAAMQQLLTGKTRLPGFGGEWEVRRLGEFVSIRNQKVMPAQVEPETLCVELEHVGQGDGRLLTRGLASNSSASKYRFRAGDVLFGRLRSYLRKYWRASEDGICTTEIWPLMFDRDQVSAGFVFAIVQTDDFIEAASVSYGTHMPRADWGVVRNFEVALPSFEEQTAIAEVLSDMDTELATLEARREKTHLLKQGMMQELLTGKTRLV